MALGWMRQKGNTSREALFPLPFPPLKVTIQITEATQECLEANRSPPNVLALPVSINTGRPRLSRLPSQRQQCQNKPSLQPIRVSAPLGLVK
jgi:hypothetical protein